MKFTSLMTPARRGFKAIQLGNGYALSVQGHSGAYCAPRLDGLKATEYTCFEVAAFTPSGDWYTFPGSPFENLFAGDDVAGQVRPGKVQQMLEYLGSL